MRTSGVGRPLRTFAVIAPFLLILSQGSRLGAQEYPYGTPNQPYAQQSPYDAPNQPYAQEPPYGAQNQPYAQAPPALSPGQLADLVAPIALYPDPLLSQVLVVSTYPQELMEAAQWLQYNGNLQGPQLMEAAQQQNWDPSIQALVAFPNVIAMLTSNMQWTSELGQAFLAQPTDVMNAIQFLRAQARSNGQLASTPQLAVNTEYQNGQSAIDIEPVNPQMMYAPAYNPYSVWGPPADGGAYPALSYAGSVFGSLFSTAVNLAGMFSGFPGLIGPSGWGWALGWLAHTLFVNNGFFSAFGFHNVFGGGGGAGPSVWVHDNRRGGPAYARSGMNGGGWRFGGGARPYAGGRPGAGFAPQSWAGDRNRNNWRTGSGDWRNYASNARPPAYPSTGRYSQPFAPRAPESSWASNRGYQPYNRYGSSAYTGGSANYRAPSAGWGSRAPSYSGFSNYNNARAQSAPRDYKQARWSRGGSAGFAEPKMNSGRTFFSRPFSGSSRPPKQEHFQEPHFKGPHFKQPHFKEPHFKSHGSGHSSHGHSGGKHRW